LHPKSKIGTGLDNAQSLFGVHKIPSDNQIRTIVDPIGLVNLFAVFKQIYFVLKNKGYLKQYEVLNGQLLIPLSRLISQMLS